MNPFWWGCRRGFAQAVLILFPGGAIVSAYLAVTERSGAMAIYAGCLLLSWLISKDGARAILRKRRYEP